ncbi:MAG: PAS domain-containing sensor histidine kinase [Gammaproteobacteria bacterium]|nr:PAS domain-containing sensor histidine kinase [Gammaproteobacteria bacterium]MBT6044404.1 PAS domain-containing sensor histidine kinase [Gammaproteobacteria bacterium]
MNTENLNTSLLDNLTTAVVLLNKDLKVIYINPAAEALLETSDKHSHNLYIGEILLNEKQIIKPLKSVMDNGITYISRKVRLLKNNTSSMTVDYSASRILYQNETFIMLELQELDRSYNISRKEMLISNHETTLGLVRGLGHEIKNPLGGIRGAAQLLADELPSKELKDYTNVIIEEADRLVGLIDRLTGQYKKPALQKINIHEILERVYNLVIAETRGSITLSKDYDPSIPEITGDLGQLIQAVLNIVRNAMQALTESEKEISNPEIILRTRTVNHSTIGSMMHKLVAKIEIIDNGPGIDPDIIENIFYPLISGRPTGTGLGLSLSQNILKNHNGLIECESQNGKTCFTISLPLSNEHEVNETGAKAFEEKA